MASKPRQARRQKRADLIFATEDPYRNIVRLERHTWEEHILLRHPELLPATTGETVRELIQAPDKIRVSTQDADVAAFESETLRALVLYEGVDYTKGDTHGRVTTVYPIEGPRLGKVGTVIYEAGTGRATP